MYVECFEPKMGLVPCFGRNMLGIHCTSVNAACLGITVEQFCTSAQNKCRFKTLGVIRKATRKVNMADFAGLSPFIRINRLFKSCAQMCQASSLAAALVFHAGSCQKYMKNTLLNVKRRGLTWAVSRARSPSSRLAVSCRTAHLASISCLLSSAARRSALFFAKGVDVVDVKCWQIS